MPIHPTSMPSLLARVIPFGSGQPPKPRGRAPMVTTPGGYQVSLAPSRRNREEVTVKLTPTKQQFAPAMASTWNYWAPTKTTPLGRVKSYWTRTYIGTDAGFYQAGYRWGVSLGGTRDTFKYSALYRPEGGINLPNGKYLVAIKRTGQGHVEVVVGKEARGIHQRILPELHNGKAPDTNQFREILGVSNHSMLISRGQPYDNKTPRPDDFAALFAGEFEVVNHQIEALNDQTGQLFGPAGIVKPPHEAQLPADKADQQPAYEDDKSAALVEAKRLLEEITGGKDIRLIKVRFFNSAPPVKQLLKSRVVSIPKSQAEAVKAMLQEPSVQSLIDGFDADPERQVRLIQGLSKNGDQRQAILDLIDTLTTAGTLKSEQATKLALELFDEPRAMGFFHPQSPFYLARISDNTKRKLVAAYNREKRDHPDSFTDFVKTLRKNPHLERFLVGQRVPVKLFRSLLPNVARAEGITEVVQAIFNFNGAIRQQFKDETLDLTNAEPERAGLINASTCRLKTFEERATRKNAPKLTLFLDHDPFGGQNLQTDSLLKSLKILKRLQKKGIPIYRNIESNHNATLGFLTDLYAHAHPPATTVDAVTRDQMQMLLGTYEVKDTDLYAFTRERFSDRWANKQILAAFAMESKPFRRFLQDLHWYLSLPTATLNPNHNAFSR